MNPSLQNNDEEFLDAEEERYEAHDERLDKQKMSPPRLNCLICNTPMKTRIGRYGEFYYCTKGNHGTISVNIYKTILNKVPPTEGSALPQVDLMGLIDRKCSQFMSITELESFYIDNPEYDPDDFWQDMRPDG